MSSQRAERTAVATKTSDQDHFGDGYTEKMKEAAEETDSSNAAVNKNIVAVASSPIKPSVKTNARDTDKNVAAPPVPSNADDTNNDTPSIASAPTEDGEMTPPLPNGEKRLHPLFDEEKIASEAAALSSTTHDSAATVTTAASPAKGHPTALRLLDTMSSDQGYPSPSGGFVPPVTEDGWVLHAPPASRSAATAPASAPPTVTSTNTVTSPLTASRLGDRLSASSADSGSSGVQPDETQTDRPVRPPSLPSSQSTSERIRSAEAASSSGSRRPSLAAGHKGQTVSQATDGKTEIENELTAANLERQVEGAAGPSNHRRSTSHSSARSSLLGGKAQSQAISARSSPSTAAPVRRRSSASADVLSTVGASVDETASNALLPPLKVRDYAYTELDPRHVGARDVGLPSLDEQEQSGSGSMGRGGRVTLGLGGGGDWGPAVVDDDDYDDSDEDDDDDANHDASLTGENSAAIDISTGQTGLPPGLYHAAYDFTAESEHELDVKVGQRVRLIGHVDGGWAIVVRVRDGESDVAADEEQVDKGLVPEAYLEWLAE